MQIQNHSNIIDYRATYVYVSSSIIYGNIVGILVLYSDFELACINYDWACQHSYLHAGKSWCCQHCDSVERLQGPQEL